MVISTAPYVNNPTCPPSQVCEPEHGDQHCALREQPDEGGDARQEHQQGTAGGIPRRSSHTMIAHLH